MEHASGARRRSTAPGGPQSTDPPLSCRTYSCSGSCILGLCASLSSLALPSMRRAVQPELRASSPVRPPLRQVNWPSDDPCTNLPSLCLLVRLHPEEAQPVCDPLAPVVVADNPQPVGLDPGQTQSVAVLPDDDASLLTRAFRWFASLHDLWGRNPRAERRAERRRRQIIAVRAAMAFTV